MQKGSGCEMFYPVLRGGGHGQNVCVGLESVTVVREV